LEVVRQAGSPGGGKIKKLADREVPLSASTGNLPVGVGGTVRQAGSPGGGKIKKLADREVPLSASTGKLYLY